MKTVDIHEAKAPLSRLIDRVNGEPFVIARRGKALVKVAGVEASATPERFGFLAGEIRVPADFDRMGARKIDAIFGID